MSLHTTSPITPSAPVIVHRSPWHSPVPYLFGGLAAMLSLIAFALLILACSYYKHASRQENNDDGEQDLEGGVSKPKNLKKESSPVFEEKFLVIMAGEAKPTFLATPVSSRASSFVCCSCQSNSTEKSLTDVEMMEGNGDQKQQGSSDQLQVTITGNHETPDQHP